MLKAVAIVAGVVAAVFTSSAMAADSCEGREPLSIYYATHAFKNPFFVPLEAGARQGASDACLDFTWTQDDAFSIALTIERMEKAIAAAPDMLVFSLADPVAMRPTVERALSAGIPVIMVNVPDPQPRGERLPYLIYIGPDEYRGGVVAAETVLAKMTPHRAACLNSLPEHAGTRARCRGWSDTLSAVGVVSSTLDVSGGADRAASVVSAFIRENPAADAFATTTGDANNLGAVLPTLKKDLADFGKVKLVTFDLEPEVIAGIEAGDILATIDQQPYLQGYLPAVLARQYLDAGLMPNDDILTAPDVVDAANVGQVRHAKTLGKR
jgi:simple sugar transport system substrate-binding protein